MTLKPKIYFTRNVSEFHNLCRNPKNIDLPDFFFDEIKNPVSNMEQ